MTAATWMRMKSWRRRRRARRARSGRRQALRGRRRKAWRSPWRMMAPVREW
jgi:hypothetical protein